MGTAAAVLCKYAPHIEQEHLGDAISAVMGSAGAAAEVVLTTQEALSEVDPKSLSLSSPPFKRINLHCRPVCCGHHPVTGHTPPGSV